MAAYVLAPADILAEDIKTTFKEHDIEFHESGEYNINTDDKLSTQGMIKDSVLINGATLSLKRIRRTASALLRQPKRSTVMRFRPNCRTGIPYFSHARTSVNPRSIEVLVPAPTGTKLRAIPNCGPIVSQMAHYADQKAAQALLTMQEYNMVRKTTITIFL